ncbi:hypothetical protein JCM11491_002708 [Sporobolomyces phaffii]
MASSGPDPPCRAPRARTTSLAAPPRGSRLSWTLDDRDDDAIRAARERDEAAELRLSTASRSPSSPARRAAPPGRARRSRLTEHVAIEPLGSRFDRGLADPPRCGIVLPTRPAEAHVEPERDRFLLVGTASGLAVVDLDPDPHSARVLPLWTGLAVHHLACHVEPARPKSEGAKGLLIGLVGTAGGGGGDGLELRMWSLAAIVNLVKWRTYNETSHAFDLGPVPVSGAAPHSRNTSFSTLKTFLTSPSSAKGKRKEPSPDSASSPSPPSALSVGAVPSSVQERHSLPLEWLNSFVKLPLPKPHTPILSFTLAPMPRRAESDPAVGEKPEGEAFDSDSDDEDLTNEQLRRRDKDREEQGKLFLVVATKGVVFVFESSVEEKRSWKLTRELTAPSTPRFMQLVRSPGPTANVSPQATAQPPPRHPRSSSSSVAPPVAYPQDLCLLLGLSHRSVLIRLSDFSVTELVAPAIAVPPSTLSRARTRSLSDSIKSTASSQSSSRHHHHHHRASSSLNLNLLDHPIVKKVQHAIEHTKDGKNVPHGYRGEKVALGRKLGGGAAGSRDDVTDAASGSPGGAEDSGRWIGSQEVVFEVGRGRRNVARFALVTKGHRSFLVANPVGRSDAVPDTRHASDRSPTPTALLLPLAPVHTFEWPTDLAIRRVTCGVTSDRRHDRSHVALVAYTSTGISVQEGSVSHSALVAAASSSSSSCTLPRVFTPTNSTAPPRPDLARLSLTVPDLGNERGPVDDEDDLAGSCSFDFGADSMWLADSLPSYGARGGRTRGRSSYMYTQSNADYVIKRVCFD